LKTTSKVLPFIAPISISWGNKPELGWSPDVYLSLKSPYRVLAYSLNDSNVCSNLGLEEIAFSLSITLRDIFSHWHLGLAAFIMVTPAGDIAREI
jgi:hypothetical protein